MVVNIICFILSLSLSLLVLYFDELNIKKVIIAVLGNSAIQAVFIVNKTVTSGMCFKYSILLSLLLVAAYTDIREGMVLDINSYMTYFNIPVFILIDVVSGAKVKNNLIALSIAVVVSFGLYKIKGLGANDIPFIGLIAYTFSSYYPLEVLALSVVIFEFCNILCTCNNMSMVIHKTSKRVKRAMTRRKVDNKVHYIKYFFMYLFFYMKKYSGTSCDPYIPSLFTSTLLFVAFSHYFYAFTFWLLN